MTHRKTWGVAAASLVLVCSAYAGGACCGTEAKPMAATEVAKDDLKPQTTCPVMGNPVDKDVFVDVKGFRVYLCCKGCVDKIKAEPDKYLEKIKANGQKPEPSPKPEK